MRNFLRPFRLPLAVGVALVVLDTLLTLAGPLMVRRGIDLGVVRRSPTALWFASLGFAAAVIGDWLVTWAYGLQTGRTAERLLFALRVRIFAHLQRLSVDYYDREMAGRIMTRMTTDVDALSQLLQTGLISAIVSVCTCGGVLVFLALLNLRLMLAITCVLPPLAAATVWFRRRSSVAYSLARDRIATVNASLQESISGVRVTQAYAREDRNIASFHAVARDHLDARVRSQRLISIYFPFVLLLSNIAAAAVLGAGATLVHRGAVSAGVVIAFLLYLDQFFSPIQQLSQVFDTWLQAVASMDKINELMAISSSTPMSSAPIEVHQLRGEVDFRDVHFAYPGVKDEALCGVSLKVSAGETVALVGRTGAGKSTIVKLLARFHDPRSGLVSVDGVPIADFDLSGFRRQLGIVSQEPFLFSGKLRDNIAYGRPEASDTEVEEAATAVGAHQFIAELPGGYRYVVAERGQTLSAGERQLVALARAQLIDPRILLLDEATSNLDLATEARVQAAMGVLAAGRTTLLVAHRLPTARRADRIAVVDRGRIVEVGTHDELVAGAGVYCRLWQSFGTGGAGQEGAEVA